MAGSSTSSLGTVNKVAEQINSSVFQLCDPPDAKLEIFFVHDIHWENSGEDSHLRTWESRSTPPVCWPKDWLSTEFPAARISCLRYDGGAWKKDNEGRMDLYKVAENLVHDVITFYAKVPNFESRWIFLIGHGLGGLVIKQMIHKADERRGLLMKGSPSRGFKNETRRLNSFLKNIRGIFCYAPLVLGSEVHSMRHGPEKFKGDLQRSLKCLDEETCRLNEWFRSWRQNNVCRAFSICAGHPTTMSTWYGFHITLQVAREAGARFDSDLCYSVMENHFDVCKPKSQSDSSFCRLRDFLRDIIADSQDLTPETADHDELGDDIACCTKQVHDILNSFGNWKGPCSGFGIPLKVLENIRIYQSLDLELSEGFTKVGFDRTGQDSTYEYYEPTK